MRDLPKKIDIDQLSVTSGGSGDPALFIHGFGFSKFTWRHLCHSLQDSFTCYAIDLPGSGDSPAPLDFEYSLQNFSDVIADFIIRKNLNNLMLVGWSLGGGAVLLSLLRRPAELISRIKSLCIIDGVAYPQKFTFFLGLLRLPMFSPALLGLVPAEAHASAVLRYCYFNPRLITQEQIEEYGKHLRKRHVRQSMINTAKSMDPQSLSKYIDRLKMIDVPSLLIWGQEDRAIPLQIGKRLAGDLKRSSLKIIERCGHMPHEECPDEVITAIREFERAGLRNPVALAA